ncbi:probable inactive protein kinase DDB_G0270444 [Anabrus simplex]|uniref:probable inactive protein kinase DDB_G0270444 n=1 Tax=Anabrus simplex TaxID=316456 RepID=UPI0035A3AB30
MDQEVEIKQEPVLHEGTAYTLFDIYEHVPEKRHLKEEIKSEFAEPGRTQDNYELVSEKTLLKEGTKSELVETGQTQVNTFEDNYKLESEKTHLKEEIKSELVEPGQTQVDTFEDGDEHESGKTPFKEEIKSELSEPERTQPFRDIKDELFVEEHALGELVPCFKEEKSPAFLITISAISEDSNVTFIDLHPLSLPILFMSSISTSLTLIFIFLCITCILCPP